MAALFDSETTSKLLGDLALRCIAYCRSMLGLSCKATGISGGKQDEFQDIALIFDGGWCWGWCWGWSLWAAVNGV
jgi:hypothetical protein